MVNSQPPSPNPAPPTPPRRKPSRGVPWRSFGLLVVVYGIAGLLLVAFAPPTWVWALALVGTFLQCLALAGPQALLRLSRWKAWWATRFSCIGAGLLMVALAIATGHGGTNDIDSISLQETALNIGGTALGILVLTVVCTIVGALTGDCLVNRMGRNRSGLILAGICFSGLFLGGIIGLLAIPQY